MKKWVYYVLYGLILVFMLSLLGYEVLVTKNFDSGFLMKAILCILGVVASIAKLSSGKTRTPSNRKALYRKAYAEFIEGAFTDDKKLEKKLMDALQSYNQEKYAASLDKLNQLYPLCQRSTDRYAVLVFQGLCCHDMKLYKDAICHYEAALLIKPNSTLASNAGLCYEKLGDYDTACDRYRRAAQIDSKNATPYNNMAQIWMRLGDYQTALEFAELAHERNQKLVPALNALTICHHMLGHQEEYRKYLRLAVASGSNAKNIKAYIERIESAV